eukprot:5142598-Prymnesium_polylepis.1
MQSLVHAHGAGRAKVDRLATALHPRNGIARLRLDAVCHVRVRVEWPDVRRHGVAAQTPHKDLVACATVRRLCEYLAVRQRNGDGVCRPAASATRHESQRGQTETEHRLKKGGSAPVE